MKNLQLPEEMQRFVKISCCQLEMIIYHDDDPVEEPAEELKQLEDIKKEDSKLYFVRNDEYIT